MRQPPQSNCPPATVPSLDYRERFEFQNSKGGISPLALPQLAPGLHSLPPILHITILKPNDKLQLRFRGLFVLLRVTRVFTGITNSPGSSLRQRSCRYTIRAGRNSPDKEFRYLRTVIVTAAVYRGFGSELRLAPNPSP